MKRPRDFLFVSAGFLILVLTLTHTTSGRAIAQEFLRVVGDVRIINSLDSPIPIRANDPIPVASSPDKPVMTTTTLAAINVFQKEVKISLPPMVLGGTASFVVPNLKLLAIESVSGFAKTGPAPVGWGINDPTVIFNTTVNGNQAGHFVNEQPAGDGWFLSAGYGGIVAYADPDSTVNVLFLRKSGSGTGTMTLTFTGHFIDQ